MRPVTKISSVCPLDVRAIAFLTFVLPMRALTGVRETGLSRVNCFSRRRGYFPFRTALYGLGRVVGLWSHGTMFDRRRRVWTAEPEREIDGKPSGEDRFFVFSWLCDTNKLLLCP